MEVHPTIAAFRAALETERAASRTVGFVPTMGFLHEGHLSLVARAAVEADVVAASIFVNPLQFAPDEDLAAYPRDLDRDLSMLDAAGVGHVLVPSVDEMYPGGPVLTCVTVAELSDGMEGASRPSHFAGVATVVTKLFAITGPCVACFGEKDYQQLAVVRRLVADLSLPVRVVGCAIVREPDGLALSSRNVYLTDDERVAATVLHRALEAGADAVAAGERSSAVVQEAMVATVAGEPLASLDYAEVRDAATLATVPLVPDGAELRLLVAARVGRPRLLDNLAVRVPD